MKSEGNFYSTVDYDDVPRLKCGLEAINIDFENDGLLQTPWQVFKILSVVPSARIMLMGSASSRFHPDLIVLVLISFLPRRYRPYVVIKGPMWQRDRGLRGSIEKLILASADRSIHRYVVQSKEELTAFSETWNIEPSKVHYCPYFYTVSESDLEDFAGSDEPYIFAGGNAHRNYEPLLEAAQQLPNYKFIIAAKQHNLKIPSNVVLGPTSHKQYVQFMKGAKAVVVALRSGLNRAAGQQTYLKAMRLGKIIIVSSKDVFGIREYIKHNENGLLVDGTPEGYISALKWVLDPANEAAVEAMQQAARDSVLNHFTFQNHVACLVQIIDELLETYDSSTSAN